MKARTVKPQEAEPVQKVSARGQGMTPPAYGLPFIDNATAVQRRENYTGMPDRLKTGAESTTTAALQLMQAPGVIQLMKPDGDGWYQIKDVGRRYYKSAKRKFYTEPTSISGVTYADDLVESKEDTGTSSPQAAAPVKKGVGIKDGRDEHIFKDKEPTEEEQIEEEERRKKDDEIRQKEAHEKRQQEKEEHDGYHFPELEHETYWQHDPGSTKVSKLLFLRSVVAQARQILPVAINRNQEKPKNAVVHGKDWVNDKFMCVEDLVKKFSGVMKSAHMEVDSNYIHPAALERIIILVNKVADKLEPSEHVDKRMSGICKDFASIVYGLILQNDTRHQLKPQLGFIKEHVFVEVKVDGVDYVVDAWRTAGTPNDGVVKKTKHLADLNHESRAGTGVFRDHDEASSTEMDIARGNPMKQVSLDNQYRNYKKVYALWKSVEASFSEAAESFLRKKVERFGPTGLY